MSLAALPHLCWQVGTLLPGMECKLVSTESGEPVVGVGERGELLLKGPNVMLGYLNR